MYCPKCGEMIPEGTSVCPKCGTPVQKTQSKTSGLSIVAFVFSIVGFLTGIVKIGVVFDIVAIISAILVFRKSKGQSSKSALAIASIAISAISIVLCIRFFGSWWLSDFNESISNITSVFTPSNIDVKGAFLLEPNESLDLSAENLETVQRYLIVVYDVTNPTDKNVEFSSFDSSITIIINDTNKYNQSTPNNSSDLGVFRNGAGYAISTKAGTIWGGGEGNPIRMMAFFKINKNDVESNKGKLNIDFNLTSANGFKASVNGFEASVDLQISEIATIEWPDGIFAVEENPDAYQVARSVKIRAEKCKGRIEQITSIKQPNDTSLLELYDSLVYSDFMLAEYYFSEDSYFATPFPLGFSCAGHETDDLPAFNVEFVRLYYPEIASKIETVSETIKSMREKWASSSIDSVSLNRMGSTALNVLDEIIQYFGDK